MGAKATVIASQVQRLQLEPSRPGRRAPSPDEGRPAASASEVSGGPARSVGVRNRRMPLRTQRDDGKMGPSRDEGV